MLYSVLTVDCSEMTDQVYMEVIVGEEEAAGIAEAQLEDTPVNKSFVPAAWATAYGPTLFFVAGRDTNCFKLIVHPKMKILSEFGAALPSYPSIVTIFKSSEAVR